MRKFITIIYTKGEAVKNIVFMNRKGGSGKSTLAGETVLSLRRSGIPLNFYDLDKQSGVIVESCEEEGAKYSIVDTPGALTEDSADWIRNADVVVVPTLPSRPDVPSLELALDLFKANARKGTKLVVVVNRHTPWKLSRDFMEWLGERVKGTGAIVTTVSQSEVIPQAQALGISVIQHAPRSKASNSMKETVNVIRRASGISEE